MLWVLLPFAPVLGAYIYVARQHGGFLNPDGLFVLFNSIGLLGTLIVVDSRKAIDSRYAWIVFVALVVYMATSMLIRWYRFGNRQPLPSGVTATPLNRWVWGLYAFSLLVSLGYYAAVGHIVLIDWALASLTGHHYDTQTARFASYAVGRYFFPGYVNQFKNSILPITTIAIVHSLWVRKLRWRAPLTIVMLAVMFVMVAGTGQRGAAVVVFIVAALAAARSRMLTRTRIAIAGTAGFALQTALLQRQAAQLNAAQGLLDRIGVSCRVIVEPGSSGEPLLGGRVLPQVAANARRVQMLWFGQPQAASWLTEAGWSPPAGHDAWRELGRLLAQSPAEVRPRLKPRDELPNGKTDPRRSSE